jgi:hypothetical protein
MRVTTTGPWSSAFRTGAFWRFQAHVTKLDNLQGTSSGWGRGAPPQAEAASRPYFLSLMGSLSSDLALAPRAWLR